MFAIWKRVVLTFNLAASSSPTGSASLLSSEPSSGMSIRLISRFLPVSPL